MARVEDIEGVFLVGSKQEEKAGDSSDIAYHNILWVEWFYSIQEQELDLLILRTVLKRKILTTTPRLQ